MTGSKTKQTPKLSSGLVIRVSAEVAEVLGRHKRGLEAWDALIRRLMGLPAKGGELQELKNYWLIRKKGKLKVFESKAAARGEAILRAVRSKVTLAEKPVKLREL